MKGETIMTDIKKETEISKTAETASQQKNHTSDDCFFCEQFQHNCHGHEVCPCTQQTSNR